MVRHADKEVEVTVMIKEVCYIIHSPREVGGTLHGEALGPVRSTGTDRKIRARADFVVSMRRNR